METAEKLRHALSEVEHLRDRLQAENQYLQEEIKTHHNFEEIIGTSTGIDNVIEAINMVAPTDANVLIVGETGTGKELVARAYTRPAEGKTNPSSRSTAPPYPMSYLRVSFSVT